VILYVANVVGSVLLVVAWLRASGAASLAAQVVWLDIGVAAVIVAGVGNVAWVVSARRAIVASRRRIAEGVLAAARPSGDRDSAGASSGRPEPSGAPFMAGPEMTRYHIATCPLVAGKPVSPVTEADHSRRGLRRCDVCLATSEPAR
jgi:hypothetical protein